MPRAFDGTTTAQRETAREAVSDRSDASLIESVDHVTVNRLSAEWWELNRLEFANAFEEEDDGCWQAVARTQRARQQAWMAGRIREMYATGGLPLPGQFSEDAA